MTAAIDYLKKIAELLNIAREDFQTLSKNLSSLDQEANDILHFLEFERCNAYRGYQCAKRLSSLRRQRRTIKQQQELLNILLSSLSREHIDSLTMKLDNRVQQQGSYTYTPRILKSFSALENS